MLVDSTSSFLGGARFVVDTSMFSLDDTFLTVSLYVCRSGTTGGSLPGWGDFFFTGYTGFLEILFKVVSSGSSFDARVIC